MSGQYEFEHSLCYIFGYLPKYCDISQEELLLLLVAVFQFCFSKSYKDLIRTIWEGYFIFRYLWGRINILHIRGHLTDGKKSDIGQNILLKVIQKNQFLNRGMRLILGIQEHKTPFDVFTCNVNGFYLELPEFEVWLTLCILRLQIWS